MKGMFFIDDNIANKISYWHLAAFLVALPFDMFYSSLILLSFTTHTLIHCRKTSFSRLASREVLIPVSIYFLSVIALFYSPDKTEGLNILGRQAAIFIFPVALALTSLDLAKYYLQLCKFFAFTCTICIVYLYADALHTIMHFQLPFSSLFSLVFMNHNFCLPINIHATYLSLYTAFSIVIFAYALQLEKNRRLKWVYIACMLVLAMGLLQLSSRAVFIALLVVVNLAFPFLLFKGKQRIRFIIVSLLISGAMIFILTEIDSFKLRYINDLKKELGGKLALEEISEPRIARWEAITELVKRSPVIGYGTGAEKEMLKEKYFEKKLFISYLSEFNTHNEYLSLLLKMGLIGLALFIFIIARGFVIAWQKEDLLFLGFLILIAVVGVSENLLDLNKGIFFYSFFFSLFLMKNKTKHGREGIDLALPAGNQA
jgi:O-antigen ligase